MHTKLIWIQRDLNNKIELHHAMEFINIMNSIEQQFFVKLNVAHGKHIILKKKFNREKFLYTTKN